MQSRLKIWLGFPSSDSSSSLPPKTRWMIVRRLIGVLIIGLALYYLVRVTTNTIHQVDWHSFRLHPWPLLASLGINVICIGLGALVWNLVLRSLGYSLPLVACLNIQTTSNLVKYLPGYAWQIMGKAYLTRRQQVPTPAVGLAIILELVGLLMTGVWVALLAMPHGVAIPGIPINWLPSTWGGSLPLTVRIVLLAVIAGFALMIPWLLRLLTRIRAVRRRIPDIAIRPLPCWAFLGIFVVAWILLGQAMVLLLPAVGQSPVGAASLVTYTNALAYITSLLALFVPAGIGVREGVMVYLLSGRIMGGLAVVVAILNRLVLMASEVTAFGISRLLQHLLRNRGVDHSNLPGSLSGDAT